MADRNRELGPDKRSLVRERTTGKVKVLCVGL